MGPTTLFPRFLFAATPPLLSRGSRGKEESRGEEPQGSQPPSKTSGPMGLLLLEVVVDVEEGVGDGHAACALHGRLGWRGVTGGRTPIHTMRTQKSDAVFPDTPSE